MRCEVNKKPWMRSEKPDDKSMQQKIAERVEKRGVIREVDPLAHLTPAHPGKSQSTATPTKAQTKTKPVKGQKKDDVPRNKKKYGGKKNFAPKK